MNLCNNVILMCYSWAFDKFEQAINRAHRLNSPWEVNVFPIICEGSIDRKLEAGIQEKGDAAELVLDGHLLGEHSSEVNLAELLDTARREFSKDGTIDEAVLEQEWPALCARLAGRMKSWARGTVSLENETVAPVIVTNPSPNETPVETMIPRHTPKPVTRNTRSPHVAVTPPSPSVPATPPSPAPLWRRRLCAAKIDPSTFPLWRRLIR